MNKKIGIFIFGILILVGTLSYSFGLFGSSTSSQVSSLEKGLIAHYPLNGESFLEGTTNLVPNTDYSNREYDIEYSASCWGGDSAKVYYYSRGGYEDLPYKKLIKTNSGTGGCFHVNHEGINIEDNKVYTISAWMKASRNVLLNGYALDINRGADNTYRVGPSIQLTTEWKRISWTYSSQTGHAGVYRALNIIYDDNDLPLEIYWSGFQVEEKPNITPFVNGTRNELIYDVSVYQNHGTNYGATLSYGRDGESEGSYMVGTSQEINLPFKEQLNVREAITISVWLKRNSDYTQSSDCFYASRYPSWYFYDSFGSGSIRSEVFIDGVRSAARTTSLPNDGNWYNIVYTYDSNTRTGIIYKNGIAMSSITLSGLSNYLIDTSTSGITMGAGGGGKKTFMSDLKIYNRALSEDEIKAMYNSHELVSKIDASKETKVSSLTKGLILDMPLTTKHMKSSSVVSDLTPYGNDGTVNGAVVGNDYTSFDGVNDYVDFGNLEIPILTTSFWFKSEELIHGSSSPLYPLAWKDVNVGGNYYLIGFGSVTSLLSDELITVMYGPSLNYPRSAYVSSTDFISTGWHHLVVVWVGGAENWHIYLDGQRIDNTYSSQDMPKLVADRVVLGRYSIDDSRSFGGQIQGLKMYNRQLSEAEIKLLYEKGRN